MKPVSAFLLGWAGVLPFAALALATLAGIALPVAAPFALSAYAAAILSFMAGVQWGIAMRADDGMSGGWLGYGASVLPALVAWVGLLCPFRVGLALMIAGFAGLLAYDLWTVRRGYAPTWYARLRWQLTGTVVVLLAAAAVA